MNENGIIFKIKEFEKSFIRIISCKNKEDKVNRPTPTQLMIIDYILSNNNKDIYQKDLEKELNLRRATISDVLVRMEKNGLINRMNDEFNSKIKKIYLSDKAMSIFEEKKNRIDDVQKIALQGINADDLEIFNEVIEKMTKNLKGGKEC